MTLKSTSSRKPQLKAPSETFESNAFARWLSHQDALLYSKIPIGDSTLSGAEGGKLRAMGVRRGVPDFVLLHIGTRRVFFVEMKRTSGGTVSGYQERWIKGLGTHQACVAYGYRDAKAKVLKWMKGL